MHEFGRQLHLSRKTAKIWNTFDKVFGLVNVEGTSCFRRHNLDKLCLSLSPSTLYLVHVVCEYSRPKALRRRLCRAKVVHEMFSLQGNLKKSKAQRPVQGIVLLLVKECTGKRSIRNLTVVGFRWLSIN